MASLGAGPVARDEEGARYGKNLGISRLPCTELGRDERSAIWARSVGWRKSIFCGMGKRESGMDDHMRGRNTVCARIDEPFHQPAPPPQQPNNTIHQQRVSLEGKEGGGERSSWDKQPSHLAPAVCWQTPRAMIGWMHHLRSPCSHRRGPATRCQPRFFIALWPASHRFRPATVAAWPYLATSN